MKRHLEIGRHDTKKAVSRMQVQNLPNKRDWEGGPSMLSRVDFVKNRRHFHKA